MNYYNENDPKAVAWLRELIKEGLIPDGKIDDRSITDVRANDLDGFVQCHFFAGIGGWPLALTIAGIPADKPLWTGSAPCPPFSSAGKKKWCPSCNGKPIPHPRKTGIFACIDCGHEWLADGRHLYPEFARLIKERRPAIVFGEQVAGADGVIWLTGVRADLEESRYTVGAANLCAAGVRAPHIRQRLYWLAYAAGMHGAEHEQESRKGLRRCEGKDHAAECRTACGMGDAIEPRLEGHSGDGHDGSESGRLGADAAGSVAQAGRPSYWDAFDVIHCRDGKARRIEPGSFPLAIGIPARVVRVRGYGNAIVPHLAAEFIQAAFEVI